MLALALKVSKIWRSKLLTMAGSAHPTVVWGPVATELPRKLYRQKVESLGYIFLRLIVRVYIVFSNFRSELRKRIICVVECGTGIQGHPRSLILVAIEKAYGTSY